MDYFMLAGGVIFIALGVLSFVNRDFVWRLYSRERAWRKMHPERTPDWDARTRKQGVAFLVVGVLFMLIGFIPAL